MHFFVILTTFQLTAKLVDTQLVPFDLYNCGSGPVSTSVSYTSSIFCDQVQLNQCCTAHDFCYASCQLPQVECDNQFCACLAIIFSNPFCQAVVFPAHCSLVRMFGNLFMCGSTATI